jgi:hypothetical protein
LVLLAAVIAGGVVFNAVDAFAGALFEAVGVGVFGVLALFFFLDVLVVGALDGPFVSHAHDLVSLQLPLFATALTLFLWGVIEERNYRFAVGFTIGAAIFAYAGIALTAWLVAHSTSNPRLYEQLGTSYGSSYAHIESAYTRVTFGSQALLLSLVAIGANLGARVGVRGIRDRRHATRWLTGKEIADRLGVPSVMAELNQLDVKPKYRRRSRQPGDWVAVPHWPQSVIPLLEQKISHGPRVGGRSA